MCCGVRERNIYRPDDLAEGPGGRACDIHVTNADHSVGVPGMIEFDPLPLTVTEATTPTDCLTEMQDQLSQLRDELNETRDELADLQESSDGKMDTWVEHVLLVLVRILLAVNLKIMICSR